MTARLAVLVSGSGTNLQAILDACATGHLDATTELVVSNRRDAYGLERAARAGVASAYHPLGPYREAGHSREAYDAALADLVAAAEPDWVVLAGWMHVLSAAFLDRFPGRVLNLHPALPGAFPGARAIADALAAHDRGEVGETGVMVHFVPDAGVDDGPVLAVRPVPIEAGDTLESLGDRVHAVEHRLLVEVLVDLVRQQVSATPPVAPAPASPVPGHQPTHRQRRQPMNPLNEELFDRFESLTFDDVVVVPGYSEVMPDDADTRATFAADIELAVPVVSAAMDRVTEAHMAIALARLGGIGVIHRNLTVAEQAGEVDRVKRSQSGMINDPVTLPPTATVADAEALMGRFSISGVPITAPDGRLVGILTNRDVRFCGPQDMGRPITELMTAERLVTAREGTTLAEAKAILQKHRIEKLPLVDAEGRLRGLITVKDILKASGHPNATRDRQGRLRAAAAVGVGDDVEARVDALVKAGVDAVVVDTAHGHSAGVIKAVSRIKGGWPDLAIVAGNVVTQEGVEALADAGADAVKVGVGAGSICTTRVIAGSGLPQLSAIWDCARAGRRRGVPLIGDGGISYSGDIVKAIAAGAETVMLGNLLAGTDEAPGELELYEGRRYKAYRGMGSMGALQGLGADRYASNAGGAQAGRKLVPEGIEGRVPYAGLVGEVVDQLVGGLRSGMGYAGAGNLDDLRRTARFSKV
ncbi:MAG: IMP dehydrogenase, partial [Acidimicrobiia bacterium]|nr:IMP dehydrogenase [Acidimicrobiia bacterium]